MCFEIDGGEPRLSSERTFYFDDETGEPFAHRDTIGADAGEWRFYLNDQVGTPDRLINSRGEIVESIRRPEQRK